MADPVADLRLVFDLLEAGITWHCACAVTRLDIPEELTSAPLPVAQFAAAVGAHVD